MGNRSRDFGSSKKEEADEESAFCHSSLPRSANSLTSFIVCVVVLILSRIDRASVLAHQQVGRVLHPLAHLFIVPQIFIHKVQWARHFQRPQGLGGEHDGAHGLIDRTDPKQGEKNHSR